MGVYGEAGEYRRRSEAQPVHAGSEGNETMTRGMNSRQCRVAGQRLMG